MRKKIGKFVAVAMSGVAAMGILLSAGCSDIYKRDALDGDVFTGEVTSNGGFVVEKGNYIYFINGVEDYTAANTFGTPLKGSLQRISKSDFASRNYANTQTVVPSILYSGSYTSGIYIYGDYVYYATPSTAKDSDGETLNSELEFKRAKLDGSEVMRSYIYRADSNDIEYRFVEVDGTVYLVYYVSEDVNDSGTSTTNIHSVKIAADGTTTDTMLAYDVSCTPVFPEDIEDPYIYYTMTVIDNNVTYSDYNQVYRVRADDTTAISFDRDRLVDHTDEDYDETDTSIVYQNYGDLVLDGIGNMADITPITQFNYEYKKDEAVTTAATHAAYTYAISSIEDGYMYYTITSTSSVSAYYRTKLSDIANTETWNPVTANPKSVGENQYLLGYSDYTNAKYVKVGDTDKLIYEEDSSLKIGEITKSATKDGYEVTNSFVMTGDSSVTYLFTTTEGDYSYLYYAVSGTNGYAINRIAYNGTADDYTDSLTNTLPTKEETTAYTAVTVLAVDAKSDWFLPELIEGQLVYASEIEEMNSYNYIQVTDLRASTESSATKTNKEIWEMNNLYNGVLTLISDVDTTTYENLQTAMQYYFWGSAVDSDASTYLSKLIKAYVDIEGKKETYLYSTESVALYNAFVEMSGDYATATYNKEDYTVKDNTKTINGKTVYANSAEYYYSVLGKMTDDDIEAWSDAVKASYMQDYPEDTSTWFDNLSTVAKVFFIIGMCVGGILVLAGVAVLALYLWHRHNQKKNGVSRRRRFKIDTTDDKDINVYETEGQGSSDGSADGAASESQDNNANE